ncbi:MAG: aminodeoxychorismate/anthranilate synthase component II [Cyclobacteriaceae bacterium]|nr:aminodeoxychorismate/anthranilate synthase component II [Cyclobacteriaceae bacterium]
MKILVFDNYDSFTYNLVHILRELGYGERLEVHRNDQINLQQIEAYHKILLSPGPGIPSEAGIMLKLIESFGPTKSILGICLGHQGIAEVYGAKLYNMNEVLHGVASQITVEDPQEVLFKGIPPQLEVGRYHSWAVVADSISAQLKVTARAQQPEVMAIRHTHYDVAGLQFHPESVLTPLGKEIIKNWVEN